MTAQQTLTVGHMTPPEAWQALRDDPHAVLVDVRTRPEWGFVGVPDLSELSRRTILAEWRQFPDMRVNDSFVESVLADLDGAEPAQMLFICRSGARSLEAARQMSAHLAALGRTVACINVEEGFEGDLDGERHRGSVNGWKAHGLPWQQG